MSREQRYAELGAAELWLFKNRSTLAAVRRGLSEAGRGSLVRPFPKPGLALTPLADWQLRVGLKRRPWLALARAVRLTLERLRRSRGRGRGIFVRHFESLCGPRGEDVFESCAGGAAAPFRLFWHHGPGEKEITVLVLTRRP